MTVVSARRLGLLVTAGTSCVLAGGLAATGAPPPHDPPLCRAAAGVAPQRAFVGQQVLYRVQIFRREEASDLTWVEPLSFPSFRTEWLPGRTPDTRISGVGEHELVHEERRALFPAIAGTLTIPEALLRCRMAAGAKRRESVARVESVTLEVVPLPEPGRPEAFTGLVGRVEVLATAARRQVRLGETVPVTVTVRGSANVWRAKVAIGPARHDVSLDVFERPPRLFLDRGARLRARLSVRFDLVPRTTGSLALGPVRIPYFDPEAGRYALAAAPGLDVEVLPRAAAASAPPADRGRTRSSSARRARNPAAPAEVGRAWLGAAGLALGLLASALGIRAKRRRARAAPVRALLAAAAQAEARGEPSGPALGRALRVALDKRVPGAQALSPEEIRSQGENDPRVVEAADLLERLERLRFAMAQRPEASGEDSSPPRLAEIRRLIRHL